MNTITHSAMLNAQKLDSVFNQVFSLANTSIKYPPYNIVKVIDDDYKIEFAVAGFTKDELEVVVEGNKLIIKGKSNNEEEPVYLHRGIAKRAFQQSFTLSPEMIVTGSDLVDGILTIHMRKEVPEHLKPRRIEIGMSKPELLLEKSE